MSWVYVFDFGDMVKVGFTTDLKARRIQIQSDLKRKAVNVFAVPAPIEVESIAHEELAPYKVQGEYYSCPFSVACSAIKAAKKEHSQSSNAETKFTLRLRSSIAKKIEYIADYYSRSNNQQISWLIKQCIMEFEHEHGKIELEDT